MDDEELQFLGSPWAEYQRIAEAIGMDVLRLPTPEGLPPALSPAALDEQLLKLVHRYTLLGSSILVHCRGGVGRAGVFACCWMLRLGLCGDIRARAAIEVVESVVKVVRNRRSIKAIETYEQVRFLVAFVDYLAESSKQGRVLVTDGTP